MAHKARIADRTYAASAAVLARESSAVIAFNTLILIVSLVLLCGAVWMHAT